MQATSQAIGATGESRQDNPTLWDITIHFADNTTQLVEGVTLQPRDLLKLHQRPEDWRQILGVTHG